MYYVPTTPKSADYSDVASLFETTGISAINVLAMIVAVFLID